MKKFILTLVAIVACSVAGMAQITLSDAYTSLVNQPGMVEKNVGDVQLAPGATIYNLETVKAPARYAQEFVYTYESLPINYMLIGANNTEEMVSAFTEPSDTGVYNVFFLVGQKGGPYVAALGQTDDAGLEAIRNSEVSLQGGNLQMAVSPQVDIVDVVSIAFVED